MPLDAICISALVNELKDKLTGARIDKIQQPEHTMLILSVRAAGENLKLLISAGSGSARIHFTNASFENPAEPPMFCMLLRKHLVGARILSVIQPEGERLVSLDIEGRDELGFVNSRKLVIELIGRSANVILVDAEGRISDCMRRMDFAGDALRRMLPGMIYRLPPKQNKRAFLETDLDTLRSMVSRADTDIPADKWLLDSFSGLSPLICRELSYRCGGDYSRLPSMLEAFRDAICAGDTAPYIIYENESPRDFSFMQITQYGAAARCVRCESFSELLDSFYSRRDRMEQQRRRSHELTKSVRTVRDRTARKLAGQTEELKRTQTRDEVRKSAELITANIYRMKKGDTELECEDYYREGCPTVRIALDLLKTPQQNAAALYKEYNKLKAAKEHLTVLIEQGSAQLDYLNSVLELLESAETEKDLSDIRRELTETGYLKQRKAAKPDRMRAQAPRRFISDDGFEILAGRSNLQNDELTTKLGRRTDYWLHTQRVHGSHVIIRCDGQEPPETTIFQAAVIAVYYSQARSGGKTPVDYTMLRFVKKPSGAMPGKVIYTDYRTLSVESDEELVARLRK